MPSFFLLDLSAQGSKRQLLSSSQLNLSFNAFIEANTLLTELECHKKCSQALFAFKHSPTTQSLAPVISLSFNSTKEAKAFFQSLLAHLKSQKVRTYTDKLEGGKAAHFRVMPNSKFMFAKQNLNYLKLGYEEELLNFSQPKTNKVSEYISSVLPTADQKLVEIGAVDYRLLDNMAEGNTKTILDDWLAKSPPTLYYRFLDSSTAIVAPHSKKVSSKPVKSSFTEAMTITVPGLTDETLAAIRIKPELASFIFKEYYLPSLPEEISSLILEFLKGTPAIDHVGVEITNLKPSGIVAPKILLYSKHSRELGSQLESFLNAQLISGLGFDFTTDQIRHNNKRVNLISIPEAGTIYWSSDENKLDLFLSLEQASQSLDYKRFGSTSEFSMVLNTEFFKNNQTLLRNSMLSNYSELMLPIAALTTFSDKSQVFLQILLGQDNFLVLLKS